MFAFAVFSLEAEQRLAIFVWLTATGRSAYPRWMAFFNPITLSLVILYRSAKTKTENTEHGRVNFGAK